MQWNHELLEKFVAPGIVNFTAADIPDLRPDFPQASYWLRNHFLNNVLQASLTGKPRQHVIGFLRRAHHAFAAYHLARDLTLSYLKGNQPDNPKVQGYYD